MDEENDKIMNYYMNAIQQLGGGIGQEHRRGKDACQTRTELQTGDLRTGVTS